MNKEKIDILLIENDSELTSQICASLNNESKLVTNITVARTIEGAINIIDNAGVDIVLLDLSVSKTESSDVVRNLLELVPSLIVIILGNKDDNIVIQQCLAAGASTFVETNHVGESWLGQVISFNQMLANANKLQAISQAKFNAVCKVPNLGILVSDVYGNITYTNHAYQTLLGTDGESLLGQHWATQIHQQDRLRLEKEWRDAMQLQKVFHSNLRLIRHDGSICQAHMIGSFIVDGSGLHGHVRVIEDLSDCFWDQAPNDPIQYSVN